jgi:Domain of unknown function (DUF4082)
MAAIVCQRCGHRNEEGAEFCAGCHAFLEWSGNRVAEETTSAVSITVQPLELTVDPGAEAGCEIQVRNQGTIVDEFRLTVGGESAAWAAVEPATLRLLPKTNGVVRLVFRPPRTPDVPAGPASFVVTAGSTVQAAVKATQAGTVTVTPFTELAATLVPQVSESVGPAEHTISVDNQGNTPVRVAITVTDPDDTLNTQLTSTQLVLDRGQRATARMRVASRSGLARRDGVRRAFQVVLQPGAGNRVTLDGAYVQVARPPSWFYRHRLWLAGGAAVALVAVGGWQAAALGLIGRPGPTPSPAPTAVPTPPPTQTPMPSPSASQSASPKPTVTPTAKPTPTPVSLFAANAIPQTECASGCAAFRPWELGMRFSSDVDGSVTAIRFYKGSQNTGPHTGSIWSADGQQRSTVTFTSEGANGWQQATFSSPVQIVARRTYVVSFNTTGDFFYNENFFDSASNFTRPAANNPPLHGAAGVYANTPGTFPNLTIARNYWVDVVFRSA